MFSLIRLQLASAPGFSLIRFRRALRWRGRLCFGVPTDQRGAKLKYSFLIRVFPPLPHEINVGRVLGAKRGNHKINKNMYQH